MHPPWEQKISGLNPTCAGIFPGSSHTSDFKIGTPAAALPSAWCYRVSGGTGQPGVSILWLGEMESWICNFCLSVAARKIVWADPWDTLACCWDVATNKQTSLVARILRQFELQACKSPEFFTKMFQEHSDLAETYHETRLQYLHD